MHTRRNLSLHAKWISLAGMAILAACAPTTQLGTWQPGAPPQPHSCFAASGVEAPSGVVHLVVARNNGQITQRGTASVVRGSAAPGEPYRIITAAHVIGPAIEAPDDQVVRVLLPNGHEIGTARPLALAEPWRAAEQNDPARRDLAVLAMDRFIDAPARAAYLGLAGLPLAPVQRADSILRAPVTTPAGIAPGASGSPVLDEQGRIRGVLTKVQAAEGTRHVALAGRITGGVGEGIPATLPASSLGVADPVSSPAILHALGAAARRVEVGPRPGRRDVFAASIPGFPHLRCVVYRAEMAEIPVPPSAAAMARLGAALAAGLP